MLLLVVTVIAIYVCIQAVKRGRKVVLRPIAAIDAIDEAVGRAAEMGRPVHFSPGYSLGGLYNPLMGPGVMAGLSILNRVADSTAKRGVRLIVSLAQPESIPIADEILRSAYATHGQKVPTDAVRFISTEQYSYAVGVLGILREERPGANILIGSFWSEALQFAEGGAYIGSVQIGGTPTASSIPFFVASCDYCLIGEEVYAARAYVDLDPPHLGSLVGQDIMRTIILVLCFLAWIAGNLNLKWLLDLISA